MPAAARKRPAAWCAASLSSIWLDTAATTARLCATRCAAASPVAVSTSSSSDAFKSVKPASHARNYHADTRSGPPSKSTRTPQTQFANCNATLYMITQAQHDELHVCGQ